MQWPPVSVDANDDTFCLALSLGLGQKEGLGLNEGLRFRRMLDVLPPHHLHLLLADSITDIPSRRSKRSRSRTKTHYELALALPLAPPCMPLALALASADGHPNEAASLGSFEPS